LKTEDEQIPDLMMNKEGTTKGNSRISKSWHQCDNIATLLQAAFQVAYGPGPSPDVPNFVRVVETMAQIELSLNLNEEDHRALLDLLSKLVTKCVDNPGSPNPSHWVAFWQEQRAIRKAAAAVLKREWDRVKTDDAN
jgi:hypothetical protein